MKDRSECPELLRQVLKYADERAPVDLTSRERERQAVMRMLLKAARRTLGSPPVGGARR